MILALSSQPSSENGMHQRKNDTLSVFDSLIHQQQMILNKLDSLLND